MQKKLTVKWYGLRRSEIVAILKATSTSLGWSIFVLTVTGSLVIESLFLV
jgi:hypothetical protein